MTEEQVWQILEADMKKYDKEEFDENCLVFADFLKENNLKGFRALRFMSKKNKRIRLIPHQITRGIYFWASDETNVLGLPRLIYIFTSKKDHSSFREAVLDLDNALEELAHCLEL